MVLVEPVTAEPASTQDGDTSAPHDSAPVKTTVSAADVAGAQVDFDDAANLLDEPAPAALPESPDLTETVEDLSVQAESNRSSTDVVDDRPATEWRDEAQDGDEPNEADTPLMRPPPRPALDDALLPNEDWTSPSIVQWRNRLLTGIAAIVGVVLAVMMLIIFTSSDNSTSIAIRPSENEIAPVDDASTVSQEPTEIESTQSEDAETLEPSELPEAVGSDVISAKANPDDAGTPAVDPEKPVPDGPLATDPPSTDEPPGLTPKEPASDDTATDDASSPLSDTLREFGALLSDEETPVRPVPMSEPDLPPAPDAEDPEDDPIVRRTGPRDVAVDDRLNDPIAKIEFDGVPLGNFLRFISDYSTIPITLDADIMRWARVSPLTAVKIEATDTTVAEVLDEALTPVGLEHRVEADQLFITRRPRVAGGIRTVTFKVDDLVGRDQEQLERLGTQIMDFVEPDSWSSRGGIGTITYGESELIIEQHETVQFEVLDFCEKLRVARGLKTRSSYDKSLFEMKTRAQRVGPKLGKSITLTYIRPAPLQSIVDRIAKIAGLQILIDWRELAVAGWSPDAELRYAVADQPAAKALATLLEPMELVYRVIDDSTLQITTLGALESRYELEFYLAMEAETDGLGLAQAAREALGSTTFRDLGGSGQLVFDEPSRCLLALLSQPQHLELQAWLNARRDALARAKAEEKTTPTSAVESRIVPASGRVSND